MIPVQPILVVVLLAVVAVYFTRVRSSALVGLLITAVMGTAIVLVLDPELANRMAGWVGIGRGADLVFYLSLPVVALLILLLYAKYREMHAKLTIIVREDAIARVKRVERDDRPTG